MKRRVANLDDARAFLTDGPWQTGDKHRPVVLVLDVEGGGQGCFCLTHHQAEVLLYDLHPHVQTLRGIAKKLPCRQRLSAALKALRGA